MSGGELIRSGVMSDKPKYVRGPRDEDIGRNIEESIRPMRRATTDGAPERCGASDVPQNRNDDCKFSPRGTARCSAKQEFIDTMDGVGVK